MQLARGLSTVLGVGWQNCTTLRRAPLLPSGATTPSTLLNPLASCIDGENPQRYAALLAADALEDVLYRINLLHG